MYLDYLRLSQVENFTQTPVLSVGTPYQVSNFPLVDQTVYVKGSSLFNNEIVVQGQVTCDKLLANTSLTSTGAAFLNDELYVAKDGRVTGDVYCTNIHANNLTGGGSSDAAIALGALGLGLSLVNTGAILAGGFVNLGGLLAHQLGGIPGIPQPAAPPGQQPPLPLPAIEIYQGLTRQQVQSMIDKSIEGITGKNLLQKITDYLKEGKAAVTTIGTNGRLLPRGWSSFAQRYGGYTADLAVDYQASMTDIKQTFGDVLGIANFQVEQNPAKVTSKDTQTVSNDIDTLTGQNLTTPAPNVQTEIQADTSQAMNGVGGAGAGYEGPSTILYGKNRI